VSLFEMGFLAAMVVAVTLLFWGLRHNQTCCRFGCAPDCRVC
jgi:hypothetical protein